MSLWSIKNNQIMKKIFFFSLVFFAMTIANAQQSNESTLSNQSLSLDEKSWILDSGFPISKYEFNNEEINRQLKLALNENKKGKLLQTIGLSGIGAGILVTLLASKSATDTAYSGSTNPNDYLNAAKNTTNSAYIGYILGTGGLTTAIIGYLKKKNAAKKVESAKLLF